MSWRLGPDGTLWHPKREPEPPCPEGYVKSVDFKCKLDLVPCPHRETVVTKAKCCVVGSLRCGVIDGQVTSLDCNDCKGEEEWIIQRYGSQEKDQA